ncbi:putative DNA binding protein [Hibiscus syriacus]|uniref:DNA binding protein n=1 Tax=Hibiscus syriacus TaxID=106335 RepID=A0A6A2XXP8_HIBSY|nr:putative DNA binding protein [Hibiscus syriacus]
MLDKSKFFFLGAGLFSGVSFALYPVVVLKTRQQVSSTQISCSKMSLSILLHVGALEITKSSAGTSTVRLGFSDTTATAIASTAAGLNSAMAAQLVWTPIDVVSQRLMIQGSSNSCKNPISTCRYKNGLDAFRKILYADGPRGLYRGFGISLLTYEPSNAVWWKSYSVAHKLIWGGLGCSIGKKDETGLIGGPGFKPDSKALIAVQGLSAAMASGVSALITMPLDTIKTRLQVLDAEENDIRRR